MESNKLAPPMDIPGMRSRNIVENAAEEAEDSHHHEGPDGEDDARSSTVLALKYQQQKQQEDAALRRASNSYGDLRSSALASSLTPPYQRLRIDGEVAIDEEDEAVCLQIAKCLMVRSFVFHPIYPLQLRSRWVWKDAHPYPKAKPTAGVPFDPFGGPIPAATKYELEFGEDGIFGIYNKGTPAGPERKTVFDVMTLSNYYRDLNEVVALASDPPAKTLAFRRLKLLEAKYNLHVLLNEQIELAVQKSVPHRDFYNVRKVDTHVHHSASMNQKHLLRFIKRKIQEEPNEVVIFRDGQYLTLAQVFQSLNLRPYDLSVDTLDVHANRNTFQRFDRFNLKYNPFGQSRLREIFLKTDNHIKGRYLAEITKELFKNLEESKYQHAEYRLSVYGKSIDEWGKLADWVVTNKLFCYNVRWLIQIPRMYSVYKEDARFKDFTFQNFIDNIFRPLFEVSVDPSKNPNLHHFLKQVVGLDCVDDESKPEKRLPRYPPPKEWTTQNNPPYSYYLYYLYANLHVLNQLRQSTGLNTFAFRPHSGEAGDPDHLASSFLLAANISHGVNLRKTPALQYLYYLAQIYVAMSPLSNNSLFLNYERNPFPIYFARGLKVALSTDDPLQFHYTKEPLIEEYSIAQSVYKLNTTDICEVGLNSVLQSGFEHHVKAYWLGEKYYLPGPRGNDITKSNVPNVRLCFREETLRAELVWLRKGCYARASKQPSVLLNVSVLDDMLVAHPPLDDDIE